MLKKGLMPFLKKELHNGPTSNTKEVILVRLYEYEGKEIFQKEGISIPKSYILTRDESIDALKDLFFPVMVKAQVLQGGRGKAGLIKYASNIAELKAHAAEIFSRIGENEVLLLEEQIKADSEAYIAITINDVEGIPYMVISKAGGMDIEQMAKSDNNNIVKLPIYADNELPYHMVLEGVKKAGFTGKLLPRVSDIAYKLYKAFIKYELDLIEINPLLIIGDNVIAGDSKVISDDYVIGRYQDFQDIFNKRDKVERDVNTIYVPLDGKIGIISYGASSTMMTVDTIKFLGGEPANFSDIAGGANSQNIYDLSKTIFEKSMANPKINVVLVTLTLVAHSMKASVEAIVKAANDVKPNIPIVANVRAAGAAKKEMDTEAAAEFFKANDIIWCDTLEDAISTVIKISQE